jgi:serine/threonine protein kinase
MQVFARKLLHIGHIEKRDAEHEISVIQKLRQIGHPNIVTVLRLGDLWNSSYYFIDMELCALDLEAYIHRPTPPNPSESIPYFVNDRPPPFKAQQVWVIMRHIARGIDFIHAHNMIHRDVKPANSIPLFLRTD